MAALPLMISGASPANDIVSAHDTLYHHISGRIFKGTQTAGKSHQEGWQGVHLRAYLRVSAGRLVIGIWIGQRLASTKLCNNHTIIITAEVDSNHSGADYQGCYTRFTNNRDSNYGNHLRWHKHEGILAWNVPATAPTALLSNVCLCASCSCCFPFTLKLSALTPVTPCDIVDPMRIVHKNCDDRDDSTLHTVQLKNMAQHVRLNWISTEQQHIGLQYYEIWGFRSKHVQALNAVKSVGSGNIQLNSLEIFDAMQKSEAGPAYGNPFQPMGTPYS